MCWTCKSPEFPQPSALLICFPKSASALKYWNIWYISTSSEGKNPTKSNLYWIEFLQHPLLFDYIFIQLTTYMKSFRVFQLEFHLRVAPNKDAQQIVSAPFLWRKHLDNIPKATTNQRCWKGKTFNNKNFRVWAKFYLFLPIVDVQDLLHWTWILCTSQGWQDWKKRKMRMQILWEVLHNEFTTKNSKENFIPGASGREHMNT